MATPKSRILDLLRLRSQIFNTNFNPLHERLGNKILRQRLKGPALAEYYPPRVHPSVELRKAFPNWKVGDEHEDQRLANIENRKRRGKGTPKKRTAAESKKLTKRRR
ncbi:hypothetical protein BT63DRAFT_478948 [Microthyrium microscopicum]|uniref:Small ribosomal subunit protein mS33 n=1 Tax=Microthyrium microscopicum TaxID=703497 RepID=A0A6A6U9Y2_9PEZI|nr:hypothetical protein BT63DRAFT_478948 [Microthyrium microscopicum]